MKEIQIMFGGKFLEEWPGRHKRRQKSKAMMNHRAVDLKMGEGWNWPRIIFNCAFW
jgi:hypothetical protein